MHLIETSYDRLKSREITFQLNMENLRQSRSFPMVTTSMNIKDITKVILDKFITIY